MASLGNFPVRIFGPGRSARTATGVISAVEASLIFAIRRRCSSAVPWLKFSLATDIPASMSSTRRSSEAGPIVATTLVKRGGSTRWEEVKKRAGSRRRRGD